MDKKLYMANLVALMRSLTETEQASGDVIAIRSPSAKYKEITLRCSTGNLTLLFEYGTLYIQGFRNSAGSMFLYKNVTYDVVATKFAYTSDYGDLGLNRQLAFTLTLSELDDAMDALRSYTTAQHQDTLKRPTWQCAVGLAEALRFQDVAMAVMNGGQITDLDWSKRTKGGDYKVRVKHRKAA